MSYYQRLKEILNRTAPLAVAFSGGVDSTLLLKVAHDTLGNDCIAITVDAPYHVRQELADAAKLTAELGIQHRFIPFDPTTVPELMHNPHNRCYLCKKALLLNCQSTLTGGWTLVDGSTVDDRTAHRPGNKAVAELGVRSPLAEAGLTKQDIRCLSRHLGLATWDKPAQSCLLTRFPHGTILTTEHLHRVEQAEEEIKKLGFRVIRVRSIGTMARLEFDQGELAQAMLPDLLVQLKSIVRKSGFSDVTIDPAGYRSGSMD